MGDTWRQNAIGSWGQQPTTHDVQAAGEGVTLDTDGRVEFMGARFRLAEGIGIMPLMAYANAAKSDLDSDDLDGLAAMYALVRDMVDQTRVQATNDGRPVFDDDGEPVYEGPSEWQRFERHAIETKADGEDLRDFIKAGMEQLAARPRKRRGTSSESSPQISERSRAASSSPATRPLPEGLVPVSQLGAPGH